MRAGQEQDRLCSSDVLEGTGFKWFGLSRLEVIWILSSLVGLLSCSVFIAEILKDKLQLVAPDLSEQFEFVQVGIYTISALGLVLLIVGAILISRKSVSTLTSSGDQQAEILSGSSVSLESKTLLPESTVNNFHYLLDTSPALVCIKDADLNYTFANKKWLDTYGLVLHDVVGKNDTEVFGDNEFFQSRAKCEGNALDGVSLVDNEEKIDTDAGSIIVLSNILPLANKGDGEQGINKAAVGKPASSLICWSTDITHLRRDFDELEEARQLADSSNQAKSSFLATMSHEIRTPMNGVVGSLDLLRISELDDSQRQLIDTINESAFSLLTIIDDILDFSKIESGKLNLENVPVSFERLLASVASSLIPNAQQKEVELLIYSDSNIPNVYADLVRLRQIVTNLGSNAVKFTGGKDTGKDRRKGRVIIRCSLSSLDDEGNAAINISVEDNGIGISEEAQSHLFQPFIQAEGSTTRRFGGSGLGLSITSRLIEMMGGEIGVCSKLGEGAVFTVSIPFAIVPNDNAAASHSNLSGLPVLFVKGEGRVNELFVKHLKNEGMPCYEVSRLKEEWSRVSIENNGQLVIIIVDCWENDLGVPALKRELEKQFSYIDKVSFLILSQGYLMEPLLLTENTTKLDYNGLGRFAFLKAIDQLVNKSVNHLLKTSNDIEAGAKEQGLTVESNADKLLLLAEDNEVNQKVLKHQLSVLGYPVEIANDGKEALSLWSENKDKYHLILTDCHMPNLDGYGLSAAVREQEQSDQRIPIIAITADALQGTDEQCRQAGMDDYLTKPLLISELSAKLEKWLSPIVDVAETVDPETLPLTEEEQDQGVAELEAANCDENGAVNAATLSDFLGTSDSVKLGEFYLQYQLSSAPIVSEISATLEEKLWPELSALAHKLKSSSYAVGAKMLGDTCLDLETIAGQSNDFQEQTCKTIVEKLLLQYSAVESWIETHYPNVQSVTSE